MKRKKKKNIKWKNSVQALYILQMMTTVSSEEIAKIYWDEIWKLHKVPWKILSNREL